MNMTNAEFESLLATRDELRDLHQAYCDDVNGPLGAGECSAEAAGRNRTWALLQAVEDQISEVLREEEETEK